MKSINITFLGDSTLDNRVWVDGLAKSYLYSRIGIPRDTPAIRIQKSHGLILRPQLSVIENVMDMLPNYVVSDYTNDGFTTSDCLNGAYKDKVFGQGAFALYPHVYFEPLKAAEESIKTSNYIVLSVGGNDVREFLLAARMKSGNEKINFIKSHFEPTLKNIIINYINILLKIRQINPTVPIVLMTQYYPSMSQNNYAIYELMKEIGEVLDLDSNSNDGMNVIYEIMNKIYLEILSQISRINISNIIVADITSSINPFDTKNHVSQIEPSGEGGKKIAQALKYIITSDKVKAGQAYRFHPGFFTGQDPNINVHEVEFSKLRFAHPYELRDRYLPPRGHIAISQSTMNVWNHNIRKFGDWKKFGIVNRSSGIKGFSIAAGLLTSVGATFFYYNRQKLLNQKSTLFVNETNSRNTL